MDNLGENPSAVIIYGYILQLDFGDSYLSFVCVCVCLWIFSDVCTFKIDVFNCVVIHINTYFNRR